MSRAESLREQLASAREKRVAIKALIGEHPDLRRRVESTLRIEGAEPSFEQWSGYIPADTLTRNGVEVPNTSPFRVALVEIADEARRRYAEKMAGELPSC